MKPSVLFKMRKGNERTINEVLKDPNVTNDIKDWIAQFGTHEHRWELLKNHTLDPYTIDKIARFGNKPIRQYVKKHHR